MAPTLSMPLSGNIVVSIVITTYDRPDDLRDCLRHLMAQETPRQIEIIVVDNHPASGLTPPVVAEFPGVKVIREERQGAAYGRNAGIIASIGEIIVTTDDDVVAPPDWLEKLIAPMIDDEIKAVTGNILPLELQTRAQKLFEHHCSLGHGPKAFEVDGRWFRSSSKAVLAWEFGSTANAAFRRGLFDSRQVGLMEVTLGPGTPTGAGEDPYFFYSVLKAGYKLRYEPNAFVRHKHRRDMAALRRQVYNYHKSCVAYHLTVLLRDGDKRALKPLLGELQRHYLGRLIDRLRGKTDYPLSLIWREIAGHLAGPWALWRSYRRVKRQGRSTLPRKNETSTIPDQVEQIAQ